MRDNKSLLRSRVIDEHFQEKLRLISIDLFKPNIKEFADGKRCYPGIQKDDWL